jgi:hypothetical protein
MFEVGKKYRRNGSVPYECLSVHEDVGWMRSHTNGYYSQVWGRDWTEVKEPRYDYRLRWVIGDMDNFYTTPTRPHDQTPQVKLEYLFTDGVLTSVKVAE